MLGPHIDHGGYMSFGHVSPHFDDLLTSLNLSEVFVIRLVFPLPYSLGSLYLFHSLIMEGTCHSACVTWSWPHFHGLLTLLSLCQVFVIRSVSPLSYKLGSLYLVHSLII